MSASNIVTEAVNNKVLPGDKTGLPWELWQLILSWLSASDLCHVSCVCKTWAELVISVDSTRWKELYLGCSEWRHPFWPLNIQAEPPSWQLAYRDQYTSTRFWCHRKKRETKNVTCTALFKKSIFQRSIHVGPGLTHESLKAALSIASDYDRIVMHPGIYDEQLEILIKVPLELVGYGELGSVILNVGIKQLATSTRLTGLVLRAPWFTSFIINVNSGYLQVDNCILEDGIVCCRNPCTVYIKFCSFRHASVILQHMNGGIIENCEFSQSGGANIFIEGHPNDERSWAYTFLKERMDAVYFQRRSLHRKKREFKESSSVTSTIQSSFTAKSQISTTSGPLSDVVFHEAGLNFEALEGSPWNSHIPGLDYADLKGGNLIGCGDTLSVCEECDFVKQSGATSSLLTAETRNKTVHYKKTSASQECSTDNLPFSDTIKVLSSGVNNSELLGQDNHKMMDILKIVTESENKASTSLSSLQKLYEKQCIHSVEEKQSCNICNYTNDNLLCFNTIKTLSDSKATSQSTLKTAAHRKSIDSHVSFHLNESISDSQHVREDITKDLDKYTIGLSQKSNSLDLSADAAHSKLPPIPKMSPAKISNKGKQTGNMETPKEKSNQSGLVNIKHLKNIKLAEMDNTEIMNVLKDTNLTQLSQKPMLSMPVEAQTSEKLKTCSIEIEMSLAGQTGIPKSNTDMLTGDLSISLNSGSQESDNGDYLHRIQVLESLTLDPIPVDIFPSLSFASCCKSSAESTGDNDSITKELFGPACCTNVDPIQLESGPEQLKVYDNLKDLKSLNLEHYDNSSNNDLLYQPAVEQPTMEQPAVEQLEVGQPEVEQLEVGQPVVEQLEVEQLEVGQPVVKQLEVGQSAVEQLEVGQPAVKQLEVGQPVVEQLEVGQPVVEQLEVGQPPVRRSQSDEVLMESEDDLSILDEIEQSDESSETESDIYDSSDQSTDSSDVASSLHFTDTDEEFSNSEESVIMLPHLRELHLNKADNPCSPVTEDADATSIASDCTKPVPMNLLEDAVMNKYLEQIHGCLIHQCRMNHSKGGLMVSLQAHAVISECDVSDVGYGIRCIQNSRVVILKNKIHHCQTSGIFMRLAASGLIVGNDVHSNSEAGIDIRKNADPLVQFNQIHHGKRSGIVVIGSGRGHIKKNNIYNNNEAGVYVLYGGNPVIRENNIYEGRAAGVAIYAGGKGCIIDNVVRGNQWGGIDIRNGGSSLVIGNSIINGNSHGIVVGLDGKASIENNLISGNAGCGIWMMATDSVKIHGNQICSNDQCGVLMLDKTAYMSSSMARHLDPLLADVNQRVFSQCSDGVPCLETSSNLALLQYNNIYYNKGEGIHVEMNKEVQLFYNAIHANKKDGVLMAHSSSALAEGNSVTNNGGSGIVTSLYDKCNLTENGIYDNCQHGILCRNICVIDQNDVVGHPLYAVLVEGKSQVHINQNRLCSSDVAAVKGEELCAITATNNKIYDSGGGDFNCQGELISTENVLVRPDPLNRKQAKNDFSKANFLSDPPQRPQIPPPPQPSTAVANCHITPVTKVAAPSNNMCEEGSKLCTIL